MGRKLQPGVDTIDEAWVKKEIRAILKPFPWVHVWMPSASQYGVAGQHDFMICQIGLFWSIEAKAGSNTPSDGQILFAQNIQKAGGLSICVNELNLRSVRDTACFISDYNTLPLHCNHDFATWTPKKYAGT